MPVDHSKHGFLQDLGTDWVALAANGEPLARAHDEESVRRAVPDAAEYVTGKKADKAKAPEPVAAAESVKEEPKQDPLDHDGDGTKGGSEKGENATASRTRRKRKPAE